MIFVNDAFGQTVYHDASWTELTGQDPRSALGTSWLERIHADDRALVEDTHFRASETAHEYGMVYRLLKPDEGYRWVSVGARPSFGPPDRTFLGFLGSLLVLPEEVGVLRPSATVLTDAPPPPLTDIPGAREPDRARLAPDAHAFGLRRRIADALAYSRMARGRLGGAGAHRTRALLDMALIALGKELAHAADDL